MTSGLTRKRVTFVDVLRVREFRVLWLADLQSSVGDQLARVALSVLVFERTSSAALTALTYALTFLPALVGGALLSGLADRLPRRRVLIGCDIIRAVLFGAMGLPRVPFAALAVLLVLAVLAESPFTAAESALIPAIMREEELYVVATGLRTISNQIAQLAGFAGGGLVIGFIGARAGLTLDAASFVLSGLLIWIGVKARPAAATDEHTGHEGGGSGLLAGLRLVFRDRRLRTLIGLAWLAGLYVVPEGVAAPFAHAIEHGHGAGGAVLTFGHGARRAVGFLMAAMPAGTALGTYLFVRWVPGSVRSKWMGPLGAAAGLPYAACWFLPNLPVSLLLWATSGLFFCYQVQVVTEFMRAVPDSQRGQAVGIASSGLLAMQGIGILLGGLVAGAFGVRWAVSGAGVVGFVVAVALSVAWIRAGQGAVTGAVVVSKSAGGAARPGSHRSEAGNRG